jgi:hypothetical protein
MMQNMLAALLIGVSALAAGPAKGSDKDVPIPKFSDVRKTVLQYFEKRPDFKPDDLITREDVEPLLKQLQKKGLPLDDADEILEKLPGEGEFLVDQLSTPNGRRFMRQLKKYPDGYDRLDRLSRMPHGQQTIRDLIRNPGGATLIEYMTTTKGGKEMGKQLSNTPTGKNFNAPTNRIYTVTMLLARLKQSHAQALKAAEESK